MKVTILQIFLAILFTCAAFADSVNAQILDREISVTIDELEIREALLQIQKKANVKFVYSSTAIPVTEKVSVYASGRRLGDVLDEMLTPYHIRYEIVNGRIVLYRDEQESASDEQHDTSVAEAVVPVYAVTGIVKDTDTSEPLPGVNVLVKGTLRGTTSDVEGRYTIHAEDGDILVFSFIGYKAVERALNGETRLDVVMEQDISTLSEVVVTGYQEIKKESYTGSVVTVTGDEIRRVNPLNIFQSLQAQDPSFRVLENNAFGSDPNRIPEINVRGATGLPPDKLDSQLGDDQLDRNNLTSNPNLPTFILDGFEVSIQTVYDLDVNRVESVTFLKDAAATAVYGSRAANGVLVIKTKAPEEGRLQFSYNYNLSVTGPDLTVYGVLNAEEKLEYERLAGVYTSSAEGADTGYSPRELEDLYYQKKYAVVSGVNTYWLAEPVETSVEHNNSLRIEGGAQSIRYSLTARQQVLKGVMKGSERKRIGADMSLAYNLNDKFLFTNMLSVSKVNAEESPYGSFSDYVRMNPYYVKRDENGNVIREIDQWRRRNTDNGALVTDYVLNPLYDASLSSFNKSNYTQIINSFSTAWTITHGITLRGLLSFTQHNAGNDLFKSPLRNEYYFYSTKDLKKRGEYRYAQTNQQTIDGNITLSLNRSIGKHFVNATLGANIKDHTTDIKSVTAIGFTNDRFDNIGFAASYREGDSPAGNIITERLVGSFLSVNYSYANKYLFDLTGRLDGSSKFGTENRFAPFWAAGIGWNLHNEEAIALPEKVDLLRLRATTGWTGGVSFPAYMAQTTYAYQGDWYSSGVGASYLAYGNESLKWQRTQNYELGLDLGFSNLLNVSARYYYKLTRDLITEIIVPPSMGFSSYQDNLGELENKGYEVSVRMEVLRRRDWTVSLNASVAHNQNKIRKISESLKKYNEEADANQKTAPLLRFNEGQSLNAIYAVQSLGIDPENGREIFVKKDGTLTYDYDVLDIKPIGNTTPALDGFFGGTVSYRNFMLSVVMYTRFGGDMYNQTLVDRVENADVRYNVDSRVLSRRWKVPGDVAFFKDIADDSETKATSRFIQDDNVLELRSVNLMYEPSRAFTDRLGMQNLRFGLVMNDLWRWSSVEMERGIDYPFARTVTLTVQTRF